MQRKKQTVVVKLGTLAPHGINEQFSFFLTLFLTVLSSFDATNSNPCRDLTFQSAKLNVLPLEL